MDGKKGRGLQPKWLDGDALPAQQDFSEMLQVSKDDDIESNDDTECSKARGTAGERRENSSQMKMEKTAIKIVTVQNQNATDQNMKLPRLERAVKLKYGYINNYCLLPQACFSPSVLPGKRAGRSYSH